MLTEWARHAILRRKYRRLALTRIESRLPVIQSRLNSAFPGYTLLVGDSHAELIGRHFLDDYPVVNAGIGGLSSRGCAMILPRLHMTVRASTAIISTGSNDIMCSANPRSTLTADGFEKALRKVFDWLQLHASTVIVLSIPPIEHLPHAPRDFRAVHEYSCRLDRLAQLYNFVFIDPYSALRDRSSGLARPGALIDGVHLQDYKAILDEIFPMIQQKHKF